MKLIEIGGKPQTELFPGSPSAQPVLSGKWLIMDFYGADGGYYQRWEDWAGDPKLTQWFRLDGFRLSTTHLTDDAFRRDEALRQKEE